MTTPKTITKSILVLAACAALFTLPSSAHATHGSGVYHTRAQKFTFQYGSTIPSSWQTPINYGFGKWDVSGQCHDWRLGSQVNTNRGAIDGQYGTLAIATINHDLIFYDWGEYWYAGVTGGLNGNEFDVFSVTIHESGHLNSMSHRTGVTSVMKPSMSVGEITRNLYSADVSLMQALYPYGTCTM